MLSDHFLNIALREAAQGRFVFPLQPRSKLPLRGSHGFKDATRDEAKIREWWARIPDANVGIATGASGLVVLDLDGPEGQAQFKALAQGDAPRTRTVRTGRPGGFHLWYAGTGIASSQVKGEHLDVRGSSGYVLAPGSVHENGTVYELVLDAPIAPVPAWVGPWVASRGGTFRPKNSDNFPVSDKSRQLATIPDRSIAARAMRALQNAEAHPWSPDAETRLRLALSVIPADTDGRTWASFGAALCDLQWRDGSGQDLGLEIWDEWSKTSQGKGAGNGEYRGRRDLEKRWRAFQTKNYQGVKATVASIFAEAQRRGWIYHNNGASGASRNGAQSAPNGGNYGTAQNNVKHNHVNGVAALPAPVFSAPDPIAFPDVNKAGRPMGTCRNARLAIRGLGVACAHDAFRDRCTIGGRVLEDWAGELTDNAVHMLRVEIEKTYRFDPGSLSTHDAAVQECLAASHDPVLDYLDGLTWDGVPRLAGWLSTYLGAPDTRFNQAIGPLVLVAAVRRARSPGCKFDQIVVLEGPEGTLKSSAVRVLAGEWFSDQTLLGLGDREHQEALAGVWLYEIADLAGHTRAEVERMKAFASRTHDRARPAYGRARIDRARRCVLFATTNNDTYLKSQTGNRRFWPVRCGWIDLEALKRDRNQLWAEACAVEKRGEPITLDATLWGDARALQAERLDQDPWDDILADLEKTTWAKLHPSENQRGEWRVATKHIMEHVLGLGAEKINDASAKRLVYSLRRLGWDGPKLVRFDNDVVGRGYTKGA